MVRVVQQFLTFQNKMPLIAQTICRTVVAALMFIRGDLLWFIVEWCKQDFPSALISFTVLFYIFLTTVFKYPIVEQSTNSRQAISSAPATSLHVTFQVLCRTHMVNLPRLFCNLYPHSESNCFIKAADMVIITGEVLNNVLFNGRESPCMVHFYHLVLGLFHSTNNFSPKKKITQLKITARCLHVW